MPNLMPATAAKTLRQYVPANARAYDTYYGPANAANRAAVLSEWDGVQHTRSGKPVQWHNWFRRVTGTLGIDPALSLSDRVDQFNRIVGGKGLRCRVKPLESNGYVFGVCSDRTAYVLLDDGVTAYVPCDDLQTFDR